MANPIGKFTTFQVGRQSTYGTPATPEADFKMLSISIDEKTEYKQSEALVGKRGTDDRIIASKKVEGSASIYPSPHSIGYLLESFFGNEVAPAQVDVSTAYDHVFKFAGINDTLTPLTVHVDKVVHDYGFQDVYINKITFNLSLGEYVTVDLDMTGKKEINGGSTNVTYTVPTTKAFTYKHGSIKLDGVANNGDITSAKVTFENNLKTDRRGFTTSDIEHFLEPTLGEAKVTYDLEFFYNSNTETLRSTKYKSDTATDIELILTHEEEVESGYPYQLSFKTSKGSMTNFTTDISGPDELTGSCTIEGEEDDSNSLVEVTLRDARDTAYGI